MYVYMAEQISVNTKKKKKGCGDVVIDRQTTVLIVSWMLNLSCWEGGHYIWHKCPLGDWMNSFTKICLGHCNLTENILAIKNMQYETHLYIHIHFLLAKRMKKDYPISKA